MLDEAVNTSGCPVHTVNREDEVVVAGNGSGLIAGDA